MNERLRIAIYIRVSTEDQVKEGYSLEVQRESLESFAVREGLEILIRLPKYSENFSDIFGEQHGHGRFAARTMV